MAGPPRRCVLNTLPYLQSHEDSTFMATNARIHESVKVQTNHSSEHVYMSSPTSNMSINQRVQASAVEKIVP